MAAVLKNLEPGILWKHFEALSAIPRASGCESAASAYVLDQAARLGLGAEQDAVGNVTVRKPAHPGRERAAPVALQAHLDMVCEKSEGSSHNFDVDPLRLVCESDWLRADGTTLGADDGLGVATALAVMASEEIAHGPLEFVFTVDEERGLTGALGFPGGLLKAKYFLNLDGEEVGTACIGCAGGLTTTARRQIVRRPAPAGAAWQLKIAGLKGGHSGIDIDHDRGNAVRILGRVLQSLKDALPFSVADFNGGSKINAIPREAAAVVVLDGAREQELRSLIATLEADLRFELGVFDPGLQITAATVAPPQNVLEPSDALAVIDLLAGQHHGVVAMSPELNGLVLTSTNLATIVTKQDSVEIATSQRSAVESGRTAVVHMVSGIFRLAGCDVAYSGRFPGWKPEPSSELVSKFRVVHKQVLGKEPELVVPHAGLECGVILTKYPNMQAITFGPTIRDVHTPDERVNIPSVEEFWSLLRALLEQL